ncbi:unnamed protein product [Ilex paraguariensis]|uniref:Uncharacterized protein n=1 Tax=Ilex paraguariensis TaxID=185542 RepID=A0ABC8SRG9_9AQUA
MRIRKFSMNSVSSPPPPPPPPPPPLSSSPSSSSCSLITTHSFASSTDSTSSVPSNCTSFPSIASTRCEGLDLLVKAIHHVASGSVVGVPYIQKRVIRRRRRALRFTKLNITQIFLEKKEPEVGKKEVQVQAKSKQKRQRRAMALPSKYHDSVLQPWKQVSRRQRSIKIPDEMGS